MHSQRPSATPNTRCLQSEIANVPARPCMFSSLTTLRNPLIGESCNVILILLDASV